MKPEEMKRLYLEHREVEEARDLDAVVATFDADYFLENVALGTLATGPDAVRRWGTVHGTMDGPWLGIEPTHNSFTCAFFNVIPFRNGKMQGEQLFFDLPALCGGAGVSIDEVLKRAAATRQP
jgi:hypothetical protein